jgi:transcriptional regulator with XRE-family HTH domain
MRYLINTKLITNYMEENKLSKTAFCKLIKISYGSLNKMLANDTSNIKLLVLLKIMRALNVRGEEFFIEKP